VTEVLGQEDDGHATAPEFALDGVAVGQRVAERLRHSHEGSSWVERIGLVGVGLGDRATGDK
jgi:hypothetical protein